MSQQNKPETFAENFAGKAKSGNLNLFLCILPFFIANYREKKGKKGKMHRKRFRLPDFAFPHFVKNWPPPKRKLRPKLHSAETLLLGLGFQTSFAIYVSISGSKCYLKFKFVCMSCFLGRR